MDYRSFLKTELQRRVAKNPRYSLRAYARDLGLSASKMSEILRGVRGMSVRAAVRIAERIGLSGDDAKRFVLLVEVNHARSASAREGARRSLLAMKEGEPGGAVPSINEVIAFAKLCIHPEHLQEAKRVLMEFQSQFMERFGLQNEAGSMHQLEIRLVPVLKDV